MLVYLFYYVFLYNTSGKVNRNISPADHSVANFFLDLSQHSKSKRKQQIWNLKDTTPKLAFDKHSLTWRRLIRTVALFKF